MDINELLKGVDCACGKHHTCSIEHVYIEKEAIRHLSELCEKYQSILIVADENTYKAAGEKVCTLLEESGISYTKYVFEAFLLRGIR